MKIKDEVVLNVMTWTAVDEIEYNTIGVFKTRDSNTPGYCIFLWTCNAYTLQEKYKCHAFDPQIIIPEGELVFPVKFMKPTRKTSYWYHYQYEDIHFMMKLKQVMTKYIYLI